MKLNRLKKFGFLSLSALLLASAAFGISALAEENAAEESHEVEILYNNLEYDEKIGILYAAQLDGAAAEGADLELSFYTKDKEGNFTLDHTTRKYTRDTVKGEPVYIFRSAGLAPKYMTKVIYAQLTATVNGKTYTSEMSSFSITEYCFKRLYKDTGITETQRNLYLDVLDLGTSVQTVLKYDVNNKPTDFYYANIEDGTLRTEIINGTSHSFNAGIFNKNSSESITLSDYTGNKVFYHWNSQKLGADVENLNPAATLTVDNHVIITPYIDLHTGGSYYNNINFIYGTRFTMDTTASVNSGSSVTGASIATDVKNSYLHFQRNSNSAEISQRTADISTQITNHVQIIEADMRFGGLAPSTSSNIRFDVNLGSAYNKYPLFMINTDENGKVRIGTPTSVADGFTHMAQDTWYNVRLEVYANADTSKPAAKVFINDEYAYTATTSAIETNKNSYTTRFTFRFQSTATVNSTCYLDMDNLYMGFTANEYNVDSHEAAPAPEFKFGQGEFYNAEKNDPDNHYGSNITNYNVGGITVSEPDKNGVVTFIEGDGKYNNFLLNSEDSAAAVGKTVVVEADLAFTKSASVWNFNLTLCTPNDSLEFCLGYNSGYLRYANVTELHRSPSFTNTIQKESWNNFRFEIYEETTDGKTQIAYVKLYINNEYVATLQSIAHKAPAGTGVRIKFQSTDIEMKMANLYVGWSDKEYVAEGN